MLLVRVDISSSRVLDEAEERAPLEGGVVAHICLRGAVWEIRRRRLLANGLVAHRAAVMEQSVKWANGCCVS